MFHLSSSKKEKENRRGNNSLSYSILPSKPQLPTPSLSSQCPHQFLLSHCGQLRPPYAWISLKKKIPGFFFLSWVFKNLKAELQLPKLCLDQAMGIGNKDISRKIIYSKKNSAKATTRVLLIRYICHTKWM